MAYYGTISRWLDDKGYGFIQRHDTKEEIFFHISDCPRGSIRPQVGWSVSFELKQGRDGKAAACQIQGKAFMTTRPGKSSQRSSSGTGIGATLLGCAVVAAIAYFGYQHYRTRVAAAEAGAILSQQNAPLASTASQQFRCDGRQHCSQMTSREEALFFVQNCPDTKMDGDHDGDPCESHNW